MANFRMSYSNYSAADGASVSASSELAAFPASYATDAYRSKKWMPSGSFRIDATNNKIYINTGSPLTATLTSAVYTTGALMAAQVQTQLNAVSTNWTCTYSTTTGLFTIGRSSGTKTLVLTTTTTAAWSTLGFTGVADQDASVADVRRNHTSERLAIDLGLAKEVMFFSVFQSPDSDFCISSTATCYLKGSATNDYDTASFSLALTPDSNGIFTFLSDTPQTYRYWWFDFIDKENTDGPESFALKIWIGDYVTTSKNIVTGFKARTVDPSIVTRSSNGVRYFNRKTKYMQISSAEIQWMTEADRLIIVDAYAYCGTTKPLFVSLDPTALISESVSEFTKMVYFDGDPDYGHQRFDMYGVSMSFSEVVG